MARDGLQAYMDSGPVSVSAVSLGDEDSGVVDSPAKDYKDQSDGHDVSHCTLRETRNLRKAILHCSVLS